MIAPDLHQPDIHGRIGFANAACKACHALWRDGKYRPLPSIFSAHGQGRNSPAAQ